MPVFRPTDRPPRLAGRVLRGQGEEPAFRLDDEVPGPAGNRPQGELEDLFLREFSAEESQARLEPIEFALPVLGELDAGAGHA